MNLDFRSSVSMRAGRATVLMRSRVRWMKSAPCLLGQQRPLRVYWAARARLSALMDLAGKTSPFRCFVDALFYHQFFRQTMQLKAPTIGARPSIFEAPSGWRHVRLASVPAQPEPV